MMERGVPVDVADTIEFGVFDWSDAYNPGTFFVMRGLMTEDVKWRWTDDFARVTADFQDGSAVISGQDARRLAEIVRVADINTDPNQALAIGITDENHLTRGLWSDFNPEISGTYRALQYLGCTE